MPNKKSYFDLITSSKMTPLARLRAVLVVGCCSKGLPYISTSSEPGVKQIKYGYTFIRVKFSLCHSEFPLYSEIVVT